MADHAISPLFNSALETGVRALTILAEAAPKAFDLQTLVYFDYLVVHSADANGPKSLHPNTPLRNGELLVRRRMIQQGVLLMVSRGLVERCMNAEGISYVATDDAVPFLDCLKSAYALSLRERAEWAVETFGKMNAVEMQSFFEANFDCWTREFQASSSSSDSLK
ncbi:Threonine transporter [Azospirillaceae bacterium]